jgi:TRAP-type C4-dicarboxylate transport system permease small subunit
MTSERWINKIETFEENIAKCIRVMVFILFFALIALVFSSVMSRYVFEAPANFTDLLSLVFMNWFIFIASALAIQKGAHVSIDFATKSLSTKNKIRLQIVIAVLSSVFYVVVIYTGAIFCWKSRYNTMPMVWNLNRGIVYLSVPLGFLLMLINHNLRTIKYYLKGSQEHDMSSMA